MKKIKINNDELEIHADYMDGEVLDFVVDNPAADKFERIFNDYNNNSPVTVDFGGVIQRAMLTMCLPFDTYNGMSYNIRLKALPG
jgi:hypothetical protein